MPVHALERWIRHFPRYQRDWIFERARFAARVKARQIGFSTATAAACVFSGLFERRTQVIISAAQDLSDEVLLKARYHCEVLAAYGQRQAINFSINNATELAWKSGGRIIALPSNPRTARSFSGDIWLDEYAYHLDAEGIRDATRAMAMRGDFRYRVFSTPNGATGDFYELITNPPQGWAVKSVSIDDAIRDGFQVDREVLFHTIAGGDERLFGQWFGCQFLDADLQYYPTAMVDAARKWAGNLPDLRDVEIYAGLDVGREQDLTALTVVGLHRNTLYQLATMTCKRTSFAEQKTMIRQARTVFDWASLHVDETGIGRQLAEELVEEFGFSEVKPVTFTLKSKEDMATRALRWFRDGRVRLERGTNGETLAREAVSLRRRILPSGNVSYEVPRTREGHGDRLWSFLLAVWGAGEPAAPRGMGQSPMLSVA